MLKNVFNEIKQYYLRQPDLLQNLLQKDVICLIIRTILLVRIQGTKTHWLSSYHIRM